MKLKKNELFEKKEYDKMIFLYEKHIETYEDLLRSNIEYLDRLECEAFIGNLNNKKILHSITHRHYKMGAMDTTNFKQLLKER